MNHAVETGHTFSDVASKLWRMLRPLVVIFAAIAVGAISAIALKHFFALIMKSSFYFLGEVADFMNRVGNTKVFDAPKMPDGAPQAIDLGLAGIGVAALLAKIDDISGALHSLSDKWLSPDSVLLWSVFRKVAIAICGIALGIYGIKAITDKNTTTLSIDAAALTPMTINSQTGHLTFYFSFMGNGRIESFDEAKEKTENSVTLAPRDKAFLNVLTSGLVSCGTTDRPVKVRLKGFASSTLATGMRSSLRQSLQAAPGAGKAESICNQKDDKIGTDVEEMSTALGCLDFYNKENPMENNDEADGRAFNVYLANRRSAEVAREMTSYQAFNPEKVKIAREVWQKIETMEDAIAIDDRGAQDAKFRVRGILNRSVAVTIEDAGSCKKNFSSSSIALQAGSGA